MVRMIVPIILFSYLHATRNTVHIYWNFSWNGKDVTRNFCTCTAVFITNFSRRLSKTSFLGLFFFRSKQVDQDYCRRAAINFLWQTNALLPGILEHIINVFVHACHCFFFFFILESKDFFSKISIKFWNLPWF